MTDIPQIGDQTGIGKATESAELATKELRALLYEFLNPAAKEAGECLATYFRYFRAENVISVFRKAKRIRKQKKLSNKPTPPRTLAPLIEKASVEDDDYLQDLWASLLATSNDDNFRPYFISILSELSSLEANICQHIYKHGKATTLISRDFKNSWEFVYIRGESGEELSIPQGGIGLHGAPHTMGFAGLSCLTKEIYEKFGGGNDPKYIDDYNKVFEAIENLLRLRVITQLSSSNEEYRISLSVLGASLLSKLSIDCNTPEDQS